MWMEIAALAAGVINSLFGDDDDTEHTYADEAYKAAVKRATTIRKQKQLAFTMATSITGLPESTFYGVKGYKRALALQTDSGSTVEDTLQTDKDAAYSELRSLYNLTYNTNGKVENISAYKKYIKKYDAYVSLYGEPDLSASGTQHIAGTKSATTDSSSTSTAKPVSTSDTNSNTDLSSLYSTDTTSNASNAGADSRESLSADTVVNSATTTSTKTTNTGASNPVRTAEYDAEVSDRTKKIRGEA